MLHLVGCNLELDYHARTYEYRFSQFSEGALQCKQTSNNFQETAALLLQISAKVPIKILPTECGVTKEVTSKKVNNFTKCYLDLCKLLPCSHSLTSLLYEFWQEALQISQILHTTHRHVFLGLSTISITFKYNSPPLLCIYLTNKLLRPVWYQGNI